MEKWERGKMEMTGKEIDFSFVSVAERTIPSF
jgi:hypothetical protein